MWAPKPLFPAIRPASNSLKRVPFRVDGPSLYAVPDRQNQPHIGEKHLNLKNVNVSLADTMSRAYCLCNAVDPRKTDQILRESAPTDIHPMPVDKQAPSFHRSQNSIAPVPRLPSKTGIHERSVAIPASHVPGFPQKEHLRSDARLVSTFHCDPTDVSADT